MKMNAFALLAPLALVGCSGSATPDGETNTTKLDAVDVQPGTISDSMIILDDASSEGTAVDDSAAEEDKAKDSQAKSSEEEDKPDDATSEGEARTNDPAPTAKKVAPDAG